MRIILAVLLLTCPLITIGQNSDPTPTNAEERANGFVVRTQLKGQSPIANLEFENIGPTIFSGRVNDVAVNPSNPAEFYVAYASSGLWHTNNNGTTFTPLFSDESVMTIGDIAVDWKNDVIWLGSGENNSSRSSYAGDGIYRSTDKGQTWENMGLPESHHIGRVILHPDDPNILWVAVLGHLYSENPERGVYMTSDGGASWELVLSVNDNSGAIDLVIDPNDNDILYAAMWERSRRAWNFQESGPGSGIYRSTNGGIDWDLLTTGDNGFPNGEGVGRIGLDICSIDGQTYVYAILDNYFRRDLEEEIDQVDEGLTKAQLRLMSDEDFLNVDDDLLSGYLEDNNFPEEYTAASVKDKVRSNEIEPVALVEYLEDANSLLFDTDVTGAEVYVSTSDGQTWTRTHEDYIDGLFYTYGYYFGQIRVAPNDPKKLYVLGVPVLRSDDGGGTWTSINGDNVHSDHHALWVNPNHPGHLILGNDGGINISYDDGETWIKCNTPSVGQFYSVHLDRSEPYRVFGGLQDNGVWGGPSTYQSSTRWHSTGRYPYQSYMGGDGMQAQVDYRDNNTLYTGFQFGNYYRVDMKSGKRSYITPKHELGQRPFRWNWQAPILLSRHQQDIVYFGSNYLHRSFDQGETFETISPDLTQGGRKGDVPYGTLATISESPLEFGTIYTGSDDGMIYMTRDMGTNWQLISEDLPNDLWVSRVFASQHEKGRVYCSLNGYRWDDFSAYVFVSDDYGQTWNSIAEGLPSEPVNVIKEDPHNYNVLYVGTDHGAYISIDGGTTYLASGNSLPAVAVHDLEVHPEAQHLVLGTHGRSFYRADISAIQQMNQELLQQEIAFFSQEVEIRRSSRWGNRRFDWAEYSLPEIKLSYYSNTAGTHEWVVLHDDIVLYEGENSSSVGVNYIIYDLILNEDSIEQLSDTLSKADEAISIEPSDNGQYYLPEGTYKMRIKSGEKSSETTFYVK